MAIFKYDREPYSIMVCGPRGSGKTSVVKEALKGKNALFITLNQADGSIRNVAHGHRIKDYGPMRMREPRRYLVAHARKYIRPCVALPMAHGTYPARHVHIIYTHA